eukprot:2394510-Ditylum_brightwellii.AAC.1
MELEGDDMSISDDNWEGDDMSISDKEETSKSDSEQGYCTNKIMDKTESRHLPTTQRAKFNTGGWKGMLSKIRSIVAKPTITPKRPEFNFNLTEIAAEENINTLRKHRYDMTQAIVGNKDSTMWYGSKF